MELISGVLAIAALFVSKFVNDHHADDKTVDELERRLENPEPKQPEAKY